MEVIAKLRIVQEIGSKSESFGLLLGLNMAQLDNFRRISFNDSFSVCNHIFQHWIDQNGHPNYPLSWKGLYDLLVAIGHRGTADKMMSKILANHAGAIESPTHTTLINDHALGIFPWNMKMNFNEDNRVDPPPLLLKKISPCI